MHRPIPSFLSRALFLGGLLLAGAARAKSPAAVNPYPGYRSAIYSDPANWLCRPDKDDVCDHDLDATSIKANGHTKVERWRPARHPRRTGSSISRSR